ncbi:MAG: PilZ domain-containing protein [Candidatus Omnitrophica bacterium]|nr:PilZ domain-containing protein [Candidatus Omnitrophota bacterium]
MTDERRKNRRVIQGHEISFLIIDKTNPGKLSAKDVLVFRQALLLDVSSTGLSIETEELNEQWIPFFESGEFLVGVCIQLVSGAEPVCALTKTMWIKDSASKRRTQILGLKLINISSVDMIKIRNIIIRHG